MQIAQVLCGLFAGRGRSSAPRHGQEDQVGDGCAEGALRDGRRGQGGRCAAAPRHDLRAGAPSSPAMASTSRTPPPMRVVAYQTAYLKANYPVEFLAASMSLDMGNTDKLHDVPARGAADWASRSCRPRSMRRGVDFAVKDGDHPLFAGGAQECRRGRDRASGRGTERRAGPFTSLGDFARRVDSHVLNKRALESLVKAGAFDVPPSQPCAGFGRRRSDPGDWRAAPARRPRPGQDDLFGGVNGGAGGVVLPQRDAWLPMERLAPGIRGGRLLSFGPSAR